MEDTLSVAMRGRNPQISPPAFHAGDEIYAALHALPHTGHGSTHLGYINTHRVDIHCPYISVSSLGTKNWCHKSCNCNLKTNYQGS